MPPTMHNDINIINMRFILNVFIMASDGWNACGARELVVRALVFPPSEAGAVFILVYYDFYR